MIRTMTRRAAALVLALAPVLGAVAQEPPAPVHFDEQRIPAAWFPAEGQLGPWPAIGATVEATVLDCSAAGQGGGQPITCRVVPLRDELRASPSRLAACYALHDARPRPSEVRVYERTGFWRAQSVLFVRLHTWTREEVRGKCHATGIDACMSAAAYPIVGHRIVRTTERSIVTPSPDLHAGPFDELHGTLPWLHPRDGIWAVPPGAPPYQERMLLARTAETSPPGTRFAAWVDLVTARLAMHDADGARQALAAATAVAPELTSASPPVFFRGARPASYVPELLEFLARLVAERWTDPCAPPAPAPARP